MSETKQWPNGLGYDIGAAEVWIHKDAFRVFTAHRVLRVPYTITDNPATAARLCHSQGLLRSKLDDMEPADAQALYFATAPQQPELF